MTTSPNIRFDNVCFSYNKKNSDNPYILSDLNFSVRGGDIVALIGNNGAGKSTLLKLIATNLVPDRGVTVYNAKRPILHSTTFPFYPKLSGLDNIVQTCLYMGYRRKYIHRVLNSIIDKSGLCNKMDKPVRTYSLGMKAKLFYAISSVCDEEVLLFDELLGFLDAETTDYIANDIKCIAGINKIFVIVSHDMNLLKKLCNRFILIQNGKVTADGKDEVIRAYHNVDRE